VDSQVLGVFGVPHVVPVRTRLPPETLGRGQGRRNYNRRRQIGALEHDFRVAGPVESPEPLEA